MSKTRGEGRGIGEKGGHLIDLNAYAKKRARRQEEKEWAAKSGPVTVKKLKCECQGGPHGGYTCPDCR